MKEQPCPRTARGAAPWLLLVALCSLLWAAQPAQAVKLRFNNQECMLQEVTQKDDFVTGSFVSLDIGAQYDLRVTNPNGNDIYKAKGRTEDKFSFKARTVGHYRFCLAVSRTQHSASLPALQPTDRGVLWELYVGHMLQHDKALDHQTEPLWDSIGSIEKRLQELKSVQHFLRNREIRNRMTVSSTSGKVLGYALLRLLTLVGVSLFQVSFIRRLFEQPKWMRGRERSASWPCEVSLRSDFVPLSRHVSRASETHLSGLARSWNSKSSVNIHISATSATCTMV